MQQTPTKPVSPAQIALTALALTLGTVAMAHAQGADPLGVSSIKDAVVASNWGHTPGTQLQQNKGQSGSVTLPL